MPSNFQDVLLGLDQLFFKDIIPPETTQDRADAIEAFLTAKEWSWEDILVEIGKDNDTRGTNRPHQ